MRRVTYILAILLLSANSFAVEHFVLGFTGNGQDHMNIYAVTATISGVALEAGDEIAAFDGTICCGKAILTQPIVITNRNSFAAIASSRADDGQSNGYTVGHSITYKFWDSSAGIEISGITAEYLDLNGLPITAPTYSINGTGIVKLSASAPTNHTPVANAGSDQSVNEGGNVTLDGSASSDADNNSLTYLWTAPVGITLSSTTAQKPTFTAPEVTQDTPYTFSLLVNDGTVNSTADQVVITVKKVNKIPIANAGPDQSVNEGDLVTLTGAASNDPDADPLTYLWTVPAGITLSSTTAISPTFTAPEVLINTNYVISLVVNDGKANSAADQVVITVKQVNKVPVANAGPDQSLNAGTLVMLDGSASFDPDNSSLTYLWTAPIGITLSSTTAQKPTFKAPEVLQDTPYTFSLLVNDGTVNSTADQVVITVKKVNKIPIANAGPDQSVNEGDLVTLTGAASNDPDADPLTYLWTVPAGITLSSTTAVSPTFTAPEVLINTNYVISLVVNDGKINSVADQVVITVIQVNKAPVANAGPDQSSISGTLVMLDGSASFDPDNNSLTYLWTAPVGITLSSTTVQKPTFTAPEVTQETPYTFSLVVNDGTVNSTADQVVITVKNLNKIPIANAGPDQSVNEGDLVTLTGAASTDPDGDVLTYKWTAPVGVTLSSTTVAKPTFTSPEVTQDTPYTFSLVVNDGMLNSALDQVIITVKQVNKTPVANAGPDQSIIEGTISTLDGSASSDLDGDALTYKWTAPVGITLSSTTAAKPTFTAPDVVVNTNYTFTLVVNDGKVDSPADQVVITVKQENKVPTANAGVDQTVNEGTLVSFDGSISTDPDGDVLTYKWTAPEGITLSSTTVAKPTFTAPEVTQDTPYTFSLVVNDGMLNSALDQVIITIKQVNKAPVANAGPDLSIIEGAISILDGSSSSDPDGDALTYKWTAPVGITLSSTTAAKPTFTAPDVVVNTNYTFTLVVNDGKLDSPADQVVITVKQENKAPTANAGVDQTVNEGTLVSLDGSASTDPDGDALTYKWTAPVGITLSSTTVAKPTFTAPEVTQDTPYTFSLVVNDGMLNSALDQVIITVKQENKAPVANAGPDQSIIEGTILTLDGSASSDPDGDALNYKWTAPVGITLSSTTAAKPTFTVPDVNVNTNYTFTLVVNDGKLDSPADQVVITVKQENKAPTANAGVDQTVNEGTLVSLDGSASTDPHGDALNYKWTAPEGITLSSTTVAKPTFTAPEVTQDTPYTFSLIVNDGTVSSFADQVIITVKHGNKIPIANAGPDQLVNEGALILLTGSSSYDPDDNPLTYLWTAPAEIILSSRTVINPTFTAPEVTVNTDFTITLVINDGKANSTVDRVVITVRQLNKAPVANAGPDQSSDEGTMISLDGSASSDPDSDALTYKWTAPVGIILSSITAAKPTFTAPEVMQDTPYTFFLVVNDGMINSAADQVIVTIKQVNKAPVANAGPDQSVNEGAIATLDGSASSDPDGDALTYKWTAPEGITLSSITSAKPTFTAPEVMQDTPYTFSLVVNDGKLNSTTDQVLITVKQVNKAPVADAGPDLSINEGLLVTLDGTASSDPDNDVLTYTWTAPVGITLSSNTASRPTFTAPDVTINTDLTFKLTLSDGSIISSPDFVVITVKKVNQQPLADAGIDQTVNEGTLVLLDGSSSSDSDNDELIYLWTPPAGITLSSNTIAKPTFTAPEITPDTPFAFYIFSLTVNDGTVNSTEDQVIIAVKQINKAPVAIAGSDRSVNEGTIATLNGSASSDPDGDALTYNWTAPVGITLSSTTSSKPTFTAPEVKQDTPYVFSLVVNDGKLNSTTDQVVITVKQVNKTPIANAGPDQSVNEGAIATLDGSASSDPDGDALTYKWTAPAGIKLNSTTVAKPTFTVPYVSADIQYTFSLVVNDGQADSAPDLVLITILNVDHAPYIKNPITDISVDKGSSDQIIDLTTVFADDDPEDVLIYSVTSNTNDQVVIAIITGSHLNLDFSSVNVGSSEIVITANSNGKEVTVKFEVEVKIPTGIDPMMINQKMIIYPNPTLGKIKVVFDHVPQTGNYLMVNDISGREILKRFIQNKEEWIDLNGNSPGVYLIQTNVNEIKVQKVILK